ncbi:MAG: carbamate kinase [Candidatus Eremiobacteraeota bacterium]|nr:carbamate kinase [Candidatus Eremiobacteraeota bacterium]
MSKVAIIAVGGNSLIKDKEHRSVPDQYKAVYETSLHICDMIEMGYNVVVTHGNGPQVGFILLRSEAAKDQLHQVPLDSCGADTQGAIGYMFQKALHNIFLDKGIDKSVATVVTQVVVDKEDPAFQNPSKPIGPFYLEKEARERQEKEGWDVVEDAGRGWRRVVASPIPKEIVEEKAITKLINSGFTVVAVGGGGIPVLKDENGHLDGTAAVIDKDFASSLLASNIKADLFLISTAVEKVFLNFGKPNQKALDKMTLDECKKYVEEGHFKPGSMLPKIKAVIKFIENGGEKAIITNPENIRKALEGKTGTHITK